MTKMKIFFGEAGKQEKKAAAGKGYGSGKTGRQSARVIRALPKEWGGRIHAPCRRS